MSKAKRYYGMHFYDGVAGYTDPSSKSQEMIYVNEQTIRKMDQTFAGRPLFVEHVDEVNEDISQLRSDADGWVVKSFYNEADGKHWCEFLVCSEEAEAAIARGYRLSNCYVPTQTGAGGVCNGVDYHKQMLDGEYHHLALVRNPRYNESVVLTPEQFKEYNESQAKDLAKYANHLEEEPAMKFDFFTKSKVSNSEAIGDHVVVLPKSKREVSIKTLCNEADEAAVSEPVGASMSMKISVDGEEMTLGELLERYTTLKQEVSLATSEDDGDDDAVENAKDDDEDDMKDKKKKANSLTYVSRPKKQLTAEEKAAFAKAKAENDKILNAGDDLDQEETYVETMADRRAVGRARYGSKK